MMAKPVDGGAAAARESLPGPDAGFGERPLTLWPSGSNRSRLVGPILRKEVTNTTKATITKMWVGCLVRSGWTEV
jgi:hypothetical protein